MIKKILLLAVCLGMTACGGGSDGSGNSNVAIADRDADGIADSQDNCPDNANADQANADNDSQGNVCDADDDNDGVSDTAEASMGTNPLKADSDGDGVDDKADQLPLDSTKAATFESAHRLLVQATFGPTIADLQDVVRKGTAAWIDEQLAASSAYDSDTDAHKTHLERTIEIARAAEPNTNWDGISGVFNKDEADFQADDYQMAAWWENAIGLHPTNTLHGKDQLRQRVAYALSQLLVTSNSEPPLNRRGEGLAFYYDILARNAFGNYRELLDEVARSPAMGIYLSHQGNRKANPTTGTRPDENFSREIMQLFSVGLYQLNIDGSPNYDANPATYPDTGTTPVETYTQQDIEELAKVMTGWDLVNNSKYGKNGNTQGDYTQFMEFTASEHEDEVAAGGDGQVTVLGKTFALSASDGSDLDAALDVLFQHPNVAPYVSRHLIMRLVTSNPSSAYIARVASVFNDNGSGVRGDLKAVVKAILTDEEARGDAYKSTPSFGKAKEPLLAWAQLLRAFGAQPLDGWVGQDGVTKVNGVYWFKNPQSYFQQAAMRSPSVFNFYSPDFVPSDSYFSDNKLVSPELQIQTDQRLVDFSNRVYSQVHTYEKQKINLQDSEDLVTFGGKAKFGNAMNIIIDFGDEMNVFEQALDGDTTGDFANMEATDSDGVRYKDKAVDALLTHLDELLLGKTMTTEYRAALKHYAMNASGAKNSNDALEARNIIRDTVRAIVTSSSFMIQK